MYQFFACIARYLVTRFGKYYLKFPNCIAKICRFLLYDLFAVAAYVIKKAVEEKEGASFVTIPPSLIYQSFIRYINDYFTSKITTRFK